MSAVYLARFQGGRLDGETRMWPGSWPLPEEWDVVLDPEGHYVKISESQLTEDHPGVARGAVYEWREHACPIEGLHHHQVGSGISVQFQPGHLRSAVPEQYR